METHTYIKLYDWIIKTPELNLAQKTAYALIYQVSQKNSHGWYAGTAKLAEKIGLTKRSCIDIVNHLESIGAIEKRRYGRNNALFAIHSWANNKIQIYEQNK